MTSGESETFVQPGDGAPSVIYQGGQSQTLLEADGSGLVLLLLLPILITAVPVLLRNHAQVRTARVLAAIALLPILLTGYFTIGGFYLPSELAMLGALRRKP